MTVSITVREVPDEVRDELAARAALAGRSLQEHLRLQLIALAGAPDPEVVMAKLRDRKAAVGAKLPAKWLLEAHD